MKTEHKILMTLLGVTLAIEAHAQSQMTNEALSAIMNQVQDESEMLNDSELDRRMNALLGEGSSSAAQQNNTASDGALKGSVTAEEIAQATSVVTQGVAQTTKAPGFNDIMPVISESEELGEQRLSLEQVNKMGLLTSATGGFSEQLWQGLSRQDAELMLERLASKGVKSPTARRIVQRMLLTQATEPQGQTDSGKTWIRTRVETLVSLGYVDAARELITAIPEKHLIDYQLDKPWVEMSLMAGNIKEACSFIKENILNSDEVFWRHALLVCQSVDTNKDALRLGLEVAADSVKKADPFLIKLLDAVQNGKSPRLTPNQNIKPLHAVVYRHFDQLITPQVILKLPDVVLRGMMMDGGLSISKRLQAGEKLVADYANLRDIQALTGLYQSVRFSKSDLEQPLQFEKKEIDGSLARALLWQAIDLAEHASSKALVLKVLWQRAESDGLKDLPSALTPDLKGIQPASKLAWFSTYVVRVALRSGNLPMAEDWWKVLSSNRSLSRDINAERTSLRLGFSVLSQKLDLQDLDRWWASQTLDTTKDKKQALRTLAVLDALNMSVPYNMWEQMHRSFEDAHINRGYGPGPMWLRMLGDRLSKNKQAEALLLLVEPMMYRHPVNIAPQSAANIVAGLTFAGLKEDAMSLALETLLHEEYAEVN